ncbi:hypothetical protein [uncultured Bradyrhizobium sp.]|uniref:hypothetical protein n=1 Tax=uncultured Bradyrhizobium sp. TaxID=199684 RepID=UPI00261A7DC4|nr:hypothetical protein [uncultured Bradyrhizobium sp.]
MGAGFLSYVGEADTQTMTQMHARLKRLHDSMAARGASPSAIARLPKLPRMMKPLGEGLPPVIFAKKPHPRSPSQICTPINKRPARKINLVAREYRQLLVQRMEARAKNLHTEIVAVLSKASGLSEYQLCAPGNGKLPSRVRAIGMMAARENGMTTEQAAAIFGRERTAVTHSRANLPTWLEEDENLRRIKDALDAALRAE